MPRPRTSSLPILFLIATLLFLVPGAGAQNPEDLVSRYEGRRPAQWGERVDGVMSHFAPEGKEVALTLDACGGKQGSGYDRELIDFLREKKIPATLFMNARWIDANPGLFLELARDPLFEIEDHGMRHLPCSITGRSVYNIQGTASAAEVIEEVQGCAAKIERLTGRKPNLFRSGTAYYDEVATALIRDMGYLPTGFSVLGDAGATFSADKVFSQMMSCTPGDIVICHMNHPEKETAEGLIRGIPLLQKKGFRFILLKDRPLLP